MINTEDRGVREAIAPGALRLAFFTVLHPIVDACSASVLVLGGLSWERILAYNAIAFAVQFPLGVMLDAWPNMGKGAFRASLLLLLTGVACAGCGAGGMCFLPFGWMGLALVCLGNALFHLSAGKTILDEWDGRGGAIGLFISSGALGLFVGTKLTAGCGFLCVVVFGVGLALMGVMMWRFGLDKVLLPRRGLCGFSYFAFLMVIGLFCLVAWRSWAGLVAVKMTNAAGFAFACAGAGVIWAGKAAGGFFGDRFGRWQVTAVSVAASLVLCLCCRPEQTVFWLVLLFVAQLATGPVLSLLYDKMGRNAGTAFGLNCLGLFTGSL